MKPKHQVEYRKLAELHELPGNPRTIKKDQFERLKKSIQDNPDYFEARPLILSDRTGELIILAGNQRYKAAKALGLAEVPTVLLPNLSEEREKEIIIRDNVENGEWDMDILTNEWDEEEQRSDGGYQGQSRTGQNQLRRSQEPSGASYCAHQREGKRDRQEIWHAPTPRFFQRDYALKVSIVVDYREAIREGIEWA